jgi:hypothetical protein
MTNQTHGFKHRDVVRAVRAASAAGVHASEVKVVLPTGATIVISGSGKPTNASAAIPKPTKVQPASRGSRVVRQP